jgi:hypothetical protein
MPWGFFGAYIKALYLCPCIHQRTARTNAMIIHADPIFDHNMVQAALYGRVRF